MSEYFYAILVWNFEEVLYTHFVDNYGMNDITKWENDDNRSFDFTFKCSKKCKQMFSNVLMF